MRIDVLFWLVTYVLLGSVALYGVARLALWLHQRKQAEQLRELGEALANEKEPDQKPPTGG